MSRIKQGDCNRFVSQVNLIFGVQYARLGNHSFLSALTGLVRIARNDW